MSDAELFRSEPETSNMPIVLASVISLALHGLLWTLPPISMSQQKADTKLNVGLVELTPEEVSRLQEFSDPAITLPPLPPTLPSANVLPPLPPTPQQQSSTPSLQQQEELVRQQIVQRQQALLQRQLQQQEEVLRQQMQRNRELIQKQRLEQQEALRRQGEQEKQRQIEKIQRESEQEKQKQAEIERRQQEQQKQRQELVRKQQELELLDQWQQQEELITPLKNQLRRQSKLEIARGMHGYNPTGTTATEGSQIFTGWLDEQNRKFGYISPKLKEDIVIKSTAKMELPDITQAGIALLVNAQGKVEGEPLLMISTSYASLNQTVIEDAKKRSFEPTGKYEIYMYRVNIDQRNLPAPF